MDNSKLSLEDLDKLVSEVGDSNQKVDLLNELSSRYRAKNFQTAFTYAQEALELAKTIGYRLGQAQGYQNLASVEREIGDFSNSLNYATLALEINKELGNKAGLVANTTHIGLVQSHFKDHEMALRYYSEAIQLSEHLNDPNKYAQLCMNIGNVHRTMHNYKRALQYHEKAQEIIKNLEEPRLHSAILVNVGAVYGEMGETEKALDYFHQAAEVARRSQDSREIAIALLHLGITYYLQDDHGKAQEHLTESLAICAGQGLKKTQSEVHKFLYEVYKKQRQWEQALTHHEAYYQLKHELEAENVKKQLANLELQKQLAVKDKEMMMEREKHEELAAAQEELVRRERMAAIGTIATDIAHEVQNPLQFVNNFSLLTIDLLQDLQDALANEDMGEVNALLKNIKDNSQLINQHGKKVAEIVSKLLAKTWDK